MLLPDTNKYNQIHLHDDTKTQVPDTEVSKYIYEFLTSIGPKLARKDISNYQFHGEHFPTNLHLNQIDTAEVIKLAKEINMNKSSAIDGISSRLLRDMILALPDQFTYILNTSIKFNSVPDSWKIASVTPIPKEGNPLDVNNYRPISLLPLPGKILEKLIYNQIINYLDNNHILDANQSGFRAKHSTNATVAKLTDNICINFNNNQPTIASYIDLKKAFDTINHQILLKKLPYLGFHNDVIKWIGSYLQNRKQLTIANNFKSPLLPVTCGVPRGSTLGPLLFLIYINDCGKAIKHSKYLLYADDTVLYTADNDIERAITHMNDDLYSVQKWCSDNSLTINSKKTKFMEYSLNRNHSFKDECHCYLLGQPLEVVDKYKYLGIILDTHLTYKPHIKSVISKVTNKLSVLTKIRKYIDVHTSLVLFKSMILSHFDYGDFIYAAASNDILNDIQILQNKCLRLCTSSLYDINTNYLHTISNSNKLSEKRDTYLLNLMYNRKSNVEYLDIRELPTRQHRSTTFKVLFTDKTTVQKSILIRGANAWNVLPIEAKELPSEKEFKRYTKSLLHNN